MLLPLRNVVQTAIGRSPIRAGRDGRDALLTLSSTYYELPRLCITMPSSCYFFPPIPSCLLLGLAGLSVHYRCCAVYANANCVLFLFLYRFFYLLVPVPIPLWSDFKLDWPGLSDLI